MYGVSETSDISELMGVTYEETPDGHHAAVSDTIDDSTALRKGPEFFGINMLMAFVIFFISPYTIIWLVIIIMVVMLTRKKTADKIKEINDERKNLDLDTIETNLAYSLARSRSFALMAPTKDVCNYLGIPAYIWRYISRDYANVGALCGAFDDSVFKSSGDIDGPIAESLGKWIRESLITEQRAHKQSGYRIDYDNDFVNALKKILHYVSATLHYPNYEAYVVALGNSQEFVSRTIKQMKPYSSNTGIGDLSNDKQPTSGVGLDNMIEKL